MFEAPLHLSSGVVPVTVSIGAAVFPDDGLEVAELQIKSDEALYSAKRGGRNRAVFAPAAPTFAPAAPALGILEQPGRKWLDVPADALPAEIHG
jgi:predicted signal transduction protein with EAL and GGDEF domain